MKLCGQVGCVTTTNWFDFGEDLNPDTTIRIFCDSSPLKDRAQKRYIARYLKKLWTDSDETWWTVWVCDFDELIRFWWRFESRSVYESYLIFKVILHHWEIGPKTIYSMIFQKVIGPDMFSWTGIVWWMYALSWLPLYYDLYFCESNLHPGTQLSLTIFKLPLFHLNSENYIKNTIWLSDFSLTMAG